MHASANKSMLACYTRVGSHTYDEEHYFFGGRINEAANKATLSHSRLQLFFLNPKIQKWILSVFMGFWVLHLPTLCI